MRAELFLGFATMPDRNAVLRVRRSQLSPSYPSQRGGLRLLAFISVSFVSLTLSCAPPPQGAAGEKERKADPLISEEGREFDFGDVIARPGFKVAHNYRLHNRTDRVVRIGGIINRKTCCGEISLDKSELKQNEAATVTLTLIVGDKFGVVSHEAEILTDCPGQSTILLKTSATAHPSYRIEEVSDPQASQKPVPFTQFKVVNYRLFSSGTNDHPPDDLDNVEIKSKADIKWAGPKVVEAADAAIRVESRLLTIQLDMEGPSGEKAEDISFMIAGNEVYRYTVRWALMPPLKASPSAIMVRPGKKEYKLLLRSSSASFRVLRAECKTEGVKVTIGEQASGNVQSLTIFFGGVGDKKGGVVSVLTDHAKQERVDVPFFFAD